MPTKEPFSGAIIINEKPIYIYVVRGDVNDLLMYLKWDGKNFNERLILITESLRYLQPLIVNLKKSKTRVITDINLNSRVDVIQSQFYFFDENDKLIRDTKVKNKT